MSLLDDLEAWTVHRNEGNEPVQLVLTWDEDRHEWAGAMFVGKEAEDSPMWGGAAHSIHESIEQAAMMLFDQFRVPYEVPRRPTD